MVLMTLLVFCVGFSTAYSSNCDDISGDWQNELGSHMTLNVGPSNRISGEYYTAVETRPGAAANVSNLTGQCMICNGKEVLHTTFTLRKYSADHHQNWASIWTNQNTFWRIEGESENAIERLITSFPPVRPVSTVSETPPGGLELNGKWKSPDNEEIEFSGIHNAILEGRTTCCQIAGKQHMTELVGRKDGNEEFTAVTFMSTSSKRIKGWTGYIYGSNSITSKTLETSWLEHEFNPSCTNGRNSVKFGIQNFTRISPEFENIVAKPETFLDKLRKFFTSMF